MKNKPALTKYMKKIAVIALVLGLAACSNTKDIEQDMTALTNKIDALTMKVDDLSTEVADMKTAQEVAAKNAKEAKESAELAIGDAQRANERIDNVVSSYKK